MEITELASVIRDVRVFYRTTPRHKMKIVEALQANGHVVAMTGAIATWGCFSGAVLGRDLFRLFAPGLPPHGILPNILPL